MTRRSRTRPRSIEGLLEGRARSLPTHYVDLAMAGFPLADPMVGLLVTVAILFVFKGAALDIYRRLMDAVDPDLVDTAESALRNVNGVTDVESLRLRWIGHRLHEVPKLAAATVHVSPAGPQGEAHHAQLQHHH